MTETGLISDRNTMIRRWHMRAAELMANFTAGQPPYDQLPNSMLDADFLPAAQLNIDLFFQYMQTGIEPAEAETAPLVERAVTLVRDGMPLTEALANYRIGVAFLWNQLLGTPSEAEAVLVPEFSFRVAQYVALMTSRIADACVEDNRQSRYDHVDRQREIAEALLHGRDPFEWAGDSAIPIANTYLVAVVRLGDPRPGTVTELRRYLTTRPGSLLHRDSGGWTALLPCAPGADATAAADTFTAYLIARSRPAAPLWVGVSTAATRAEIPGCFAEARTLAETGRALRRKQPICRRDEMTFEYLVAGSGPTRAELARILNPLDGQPILFETLSVFIDHDFNQNAAARELCVHRNTVTYRLSRIAELTGRDPQQPTGIATLMAARIARKLGVSEENS